MPALEASGDFHKPVCANPDGSWAAFPLRGISRCRQEGASTPSGIGPPFSVTSMESTGLEPVTYCRNDSHTRCANRSILACGPGAGLVDAAAVSSVSIVASDVSWWRRHAPSPFRLRSDRNGTHCMRSLHRPGRRGLNPPSLTDARVHENHSCYYSALLDSRYARWQDAQQSVFAGGDRQPLLEDPWTFLH